MLLNWPTSEYKLEYKNLPAELRKKIWEDNLKFRECCAENNRVQHFWYYTKGHGSKQGASSETIAVQYVDDTVERHENGGVSVQTEPSIQVDAKNKELSENTEIPTKLKSALKKRQTEIVPTSSRSCKDVSIQTPRWDCIMKQIYESRPKKVLSEPCFSTNFTYAGASMRTYSSRSPSKTTKEEKKIPFLSYGWNDSKKDVGSKRTFNINASSEEVYPAALHALSKRREMLKRTDAMRRQRPSTAPLLSPVNHSSLWMTEYQDIFTRPQSAPFASKGVRLQ